MCGEEGHWARNCEKRRREQRYFHCQRIGHMTRECPIKVEETKCWKYRIKEHIECTVGERKGKFNRGEAGTPKLGRKDKERKGVMFGGGGVEDE